MIAKPLGNKNVPGFPFEKFCWYLGIFFPRALVVLGGFDPLAGGVGGTKVDRIFFSILDDLWWSPFVAS